MASEEALGGSSGVLAPEDSSSMDPGVAGLLSMFSSGVGGTEDSGDSDIAVDVDGSAEMVFCRSGRFAIEETATCGRLGGSKDAFIAFPTASLLLRCP